MSKVWVYADVRPGKVDASALELLTKARALADTVEAVALGPGATDAAGTLGEYGAQAVHASDDEVYSDVLATAAAHTLFQLVQEHQPNLILFSQTYDARHGAGRRGDPDLRRHEDRQGLAGRPRSQAGPDAAEVRGGRAPRGWHGERRAGGGPGPRRREEGPAGGAARGGGHRSQARGGQGRDLRRPGAAGPRQLQAPGRAGRGAGRRGGGRHQGGRGLRVGSVQLSGGPDR